MTVNTKQHPPTLLQCTSSSAIVLYTVNRKNRTLLDFCLTSPNANLFLPRDAMLSVVYAVVVCQSVCLSQGLNSVGAGGSWDPTPLT